MTSCSSCAVSQFLEGAIDLNCPVFFEELCVVQGCCPACGDVSDAYVACQANLAETDILETSFFTVDCVLAIDECITAPSSTATSASSSAPSYQPPSMPSVSPITPAPASMSSAPITPSPTAAPSPLLALNTTLRDISITMVNVSKLSDAEVAEWVNVQAAWFVRYFKGEMRRRGRFLQRQRDSRGITTEIEFVGQEVTSDASGMPSNAIVFNQIIGFEEPPASIDAGPTKAPTGASPLDIDNLSAEELAIAPFEDIKANTKLALELRSKIVSFENVKIPLEVPEVPDQTKIVDKPTSAGANGFLSKCVVAVFLLALFMSL
jgi:hypothetical protein